MIRLRSEEKKWFEDDEFVIEEKFLSVGKKYFIKNKERDLVGYCERKSLKIQEDIRVFADETKAEEIFKIKQRNIMNFSGLFEIIDSKSEETIGYLKRKGFKSIILGEWILLDPERNEIGKVRADSLVKEAARYRFFKHIPYRYKMFYDNRYAGVLKQRFSVLKNEYKVQIKEEPAHGLDRRLVISIALLLDAVESRFRDLGK